MRILLLSSELVPERAGGIASYTAIIAPALAARGHEVHVLSCAPEHERRDDLADGVWWHRRRLIGGDRSSRTQRARQSAQRLATALTCVRSLPSIGRFDVIESPEWMAESLFVGLTTRTPVVVNLHTPLHVLFSFDVPRNVRDLRVADRLERSAARRAAVVTASSALLGDALHTSGWLSRRPEIIRLPIDIDVWNDVGPVHDTGPNILVVGRLEPRKAPEMAVEAAALLAPDVPGLQLTFAGRSRGFLRGGKPYGDWVAELADHTGLSIRFVTQVPRAEMNRLYAEARVVAVPSRFESFSVAALEAMASGRPVVFTSGVGAGEVLRGTAAGTEVPVDDAPALADALRPYLADAQFAVTAGTEAQNLARMHFRPDIIAAQREKCFEDARFGHRKGNTCSPAR